MGAFVLNLGAAASYADTGTTSVSTAGTETTLAVKIRVSGQLLQNAANAFSTHRICAIGGATQGSARLTVSVNGNNGDVRLNLGVGDFDNTAHTAETAGFSVDTALYYDIYADYGSNAGFIGIAQGGVEVVTPATRGASTMGANASNGRVRVGAALWTTGDGATGRVDGIAIYSAKKTTTTDRYADPDGESTTGRLAYWAFPEGTGTTTAENGGGTSMSFSATSAPTWVAGGVWDGTAGGGSGSTVNATLSDSLSFADTFSRDVALTRTLADTRSFSETPRRTATFARLLGDTFSFADAFNRALAVDRELSDAFSFADLLDRDLDLLRRLSDASTYGEDLSYVTESTGGSLKSATLADALSFGDTLARNGVFDRDLVEALSLTENALVRRELLRALADAVTFSDALGTDLDIDRILSDTFALSDSMVVDAATFGSIAAALHRWHTARRLRHHRCTHQRGT